MSRYPAVKESHEKHFPAKYLANFPLLNNTKLRLVGEIGNKLRSSKDENLLFSNGSEQTLVW